MVKRNSARAIITWCGCAVELFECSAQMLPAEQLATFFVKTDAAPNRSAEVDCQINQQGKNLRRVIHHLLCDVANSQFLLQLVCRCGNPLEELFSYVDLGNSVWNTQHEFLSMVLVAGAAEKEPASKQQFMSPND